MKTDKTGTPIVLYSDHPLLESQEFTVELSTKGVLFSHDGVTRRRVIREEFALRCDVPDERSIWALGEMLGDQLADVVFDLCDACDDAKQSTFMRGVQHGMSSAIDAYWDDEAETPKPEEPVAAKPVTPADESQAAFLTWAERDVLRVLIAEWLQARDRHVEACDFDAASEARQRSDILSAILNKCQLKGNHNG